MAHKARSLIVDINWQQSSLERELHRSSTNMDIMSFYLEHRHKPKPKRVAGFRKPKDRHAVGLSSLAQDIFPKYPLPLKFLAMQQSHILRHPPTHAASAKAGALAIPADATEPSDIPQSPIGQVGPLDEIS
eukprot:NODE_6424_length_536_cov_23.643032_g6259_i0.p1 GENE.NODE_6424_length_536_cov_23.643032_g6259_i0~~NODE_6424_length_536_cov_23.643032_g6259_i0.p1  ORF type:complete len:142 (+),score=28.19 NODE_6424_length_536_cov_23.643032_g6259_i0:35-427(+)